MREFREDSVKNASLRPVIAAQMEQAGLYEDMPYRGAGGNGDVLTAEAAEKMPAEGEVSRIYVYTVYVLCALLVSIICLSLTVYKAIRREFLCATDACLLIVNSSMGGGAGARGVIFVSSDYASRRDVRESCSDGVPAINSGRCGRPDESNRTNRM